ncbi:MAG: PAS domain S-box protein, partial [Desulfobacteraceae bacterium]
MDEKNWLLAHPSIRVGVGVAFPPFMWTEHENSQWAFKGMVSDYVNLLAQRLGIDMNIVYDIPFNQALDRGKKREIDFFPCLSKTPGRSDFLLFTKPYLSYPLVILTREDAPILGSVSDLKGKRFAVVKHLVVYSKLQNDYPGLELDYIYTKKVEENLDVVSLGQADACIINLAAASYYIQRKGLTNLKVAAPVNWEGVQLSMGVRKDWPVFKAIIDKAMATVSQEEKDRISQRWIRVEMDTGVNIDLIWRWGLGIGTATFVLFSFFFFWNRKLAREIEKTETAQKALKESERHLSTLIGNLPGMAYRCLNDQDWTMLYLSDGCEPLTGYAPSELVLNTSTAYNDLILEEDRPMVWNAVQQAVDNHRPFTVEYRIKDKSGSEKWVWEKGVAIQESDTGNLVLEGFINDISDRRRVENDLRKSESLLRRVFEILPIGLWFADKTGKLIKGNTAGIDIWGAEPHVGPEEYGVFKARRLPSMEEIAPDDWALAHTIRHGITVRDELLEIEAFDGSKKTILNSTAPVLDDDGNLDAAVVVNLDITDRIRAERDARQSEARLNALINAIPDLIWLKDPDGIYLSCNPTFELFFGALESDIIGKTDYDFVDAQLADFFRDHDQKAIEAGQPSANEEWLTFRANGYHGLFETVKIPMHDIDGNLIGVLGVARDITKRHKDQKEKIQLERRLKQSQKMESIGTLAGGIAHDFNNILSSIIGFSEIALKNVDQGSELEDDLMEIHHAGKRAAELVKQILIFARKSGDELGPIKIQPIATEALSLLRSTIPSNISIVETLNSTLTLTGNETQIHQIFMNLCTNASQAMEMDGGTLKVSVTDQIIGPDTPGDHSGLPPGQYVKIEISDTGSGIPENEIESIFEPYFTTKEVGEGTGLGLATVHGIVEQYAGRIWVTSSDAQGTRFTILLPAKPSSQTETPPSNDGIPVGNESILLIDDEAAITKMTSRFLSRLGYRSVQVNRSAEALTLFERQPDQFDLVIMDMTMPGITGDKLAARFLEIKPDLPIILCTGFSKILTKEDAMELGISAYIEKPIDNLALSRT